MRHRNVQFVQKISSLPLFVAELVLAFRRRLSQVAQLWVRPGYLNLGELTPLRKQGPVIVYLWREQLQLALTAQFQFRDLRDFPILLPTADNLENLRLTLRPGTVAILVADGLGDRRRLPPEILLLAKEVRASLVPALAQGSITAPSRWLLLGGLPLVGCRIDLTLGRALALPASGASNRDLAEGAFRAELAVAELGRRHGDTH